MTGFYSRCFAVVWALLGLIMTSLVVGAIVTALTTVNGAAQFKIYGSEVGALNGSFEEKLGLLRNGKVNQSTYFLLLLSYFLSFLLYSTCSLYPPR